MQLDEYHLTYCSNIHPGENWIETFENLREYIPKVKAQVSPDKAFGIGLRLSDKASLELIEEAKLVVFKKWLNEVDCYVFTLNGFPFGDFHHEIVKDRVHVPDWTTQKRVGYTSRLFSILAALLPEGMEGGISTSPLSYKYWNSTLANKNRVLKEATLHIAQIAGELYEVAQEHGQILHLDIEPEPDGLLENTAEVVDWYNNWLLPRGEAYLNKKYELLGEEAERALKEHIRICYDVCHFAIVYERPTEVFSLLKKQGIRVGKIQLSAALKVNLPQNVGNRSKIKDTLSAFVESTYLHQVVQRDSMHQLSHFPDLPKALDNLNDPAAQEWRVHFHVPVFLAAYGELESTQEDILEVLAYLKTEELTHHLEVETYTWEVLPDDIQLELADSIVRELDWIKKHLKR